MGVILITHDLGIVARVADKVAVMYAGQVVETGRVAEVFANPLHPYTRALLDCIPVPGKTKAGEHLGSILGLVPRLVGDLGGCHFRNRCTLANPECVREAVALRDFGQDRSVRCIVP
jgi:peptide/nickel transport system ATP-binding protein